MKENKFLLERALHLASACAVLALILFVPATMSQNKGLGIFFYILSALLLIVGGVILYLAHRAKKGQINCFLRDAETGESLSVNALDAETVRKETDRYLGAYSKDILSLWRDIPRELRARLEREGTFRPLVAYRLLLALSECEEAQIRATFTQADSRAVGYICRAIRDSGDGDMADYIFELKRNAERDTARIGGFFRKNRGCFADRMLRYVKRNIQDFYIVPQKQ